MRPRNDLSRSFDLSGSQKTYLSRLKPEDGMMTAIRNAESDIRAALSANLPGHLQKTLPGGEMPPKPKFRRQGSGAYGLLNDPIRGSKNYAEADADLGVYQPLKTLKSATDDPAIAASVYLDTVEAVLTALATAKKWSVKRKSCCLRVKVRDDAHVDVTCYVVPDEDFRQMAKAYAFDHAVELAAGEEFERDITWNEIPERPLLATKDGWRRSNAKAIHETIENAARLHGPSLKPIIRFIKGARDYHDEVTGPCSIAITLILVRDLSGSIATAREDLGVLAAFGTVADGLMKKLPTPGDEDIDILGTMDYTVRISLANWFRQAQAQMREAIFEQSLDQAHETLRGIFGARFPRLSEAPSQPATPSTSSGRYRVEPGRGFQAAHPAMSALHDTLFPRINAALKPSGWVARPTAEGIEFFRYEPVTSGEFEISMRFIPHLMHFPPFVHLKIVKGNPQDFPWHRIGDTLCHFDASTAEWDPESPHFVDHVVFVARHAVEEFHRLQKGIALTTADMEFAVQWKGLRSYLDIPDSAWPRDAPAELERYEFKVPETGLTHDIYRLASADRSRYKSYPDGVHHHLVPAIYVELQKHPGPMLDHWPPETLGDLNVFLNHHRPRDAKRVWHRLAEALWDQDSDRSNVLLVNQTPAGRFGAIIKAAGHPKKFRRHTFADHIKGRSLLTRSIPITRCSFERIDEDFVLGRNQPDSRPPLARKNIHLIGLGTIGATLAERLVQAGAGKDGGELHLFDFDRLRTENLGRHLLGVPYLGMAKATAVAKHLERTRLAVNITPHVGFWHSPSVHAGADLVIDATAMPNIGAALSNVARVERKWHVLTAFVEGEGWVAGAFLYRGIAGEACRTCLEPWPGGTGCHIQPSHATAPKDNGCGSVYTPYRAAASDIAAALASELACDWANGLNGETYRTVKMSCAPRHVHKSRNESPASKSSCICARYIASNDLILKPKNVEPTVIPKTVTAGMCGPSGSMI